MNTLVSRDPPEASGWVLQTHGWYSHILASPQIFPKGAGTARTHQGVEGGVRVPVPRTQRELCGETKESAGKRTQRSKSQEAAGPQGMVTSCHLRAQQESSGVRSALALF